MVTNGGYAKVSLIATEAYRKCIVFERTIGIVPFDSKYQAYYNHKPGGGQYGRLGEKVEVSASPTTNSRGKLALRVKTDDSQLRSTTKEIKIEANGRAYSKSTKNLGDKLMNFITYQFNDVLENGGNLSIKWIGNDLKGTPCISYGKYFDFKGGDALGSKGSKELYDDGTYKFFYNPRIAVKVVPGIGVEFGPVSSEDTRFVVTLYGGYDGAKDQFLDQVKTIERKMAGEAIISPYELSNPKGTDINIIRYLHKKISDEGGVI